MDIKDPKTQKLLLGALVVIIMVYFWHSKMFEPNSVQLDAKRANYESLMTNLKMVELKAKSLEGLKKEYDRLLNRYQSIEQLLPEEQQVPEFLMQLHSASMMSQSVVTDVSPQPSTGETFYNTSDYGIQFTGTYHELGKFLAAVSNFPFITNTSGLKINGLPPNEIARQTTEEKRKKGDYDNRTMTANFILSTYFVKQDEKLKGVQF